MAGKRFFISYSTAEAQDFAYNLHDALVGGQPKYEAWLDKHQLKPGGDWDTQIDHAIRDCAGLLFVMTPDSVMDNSVCKLEVSRALSYKKSIIPIYLQESRLPFRLGDRQYINFQDFETGIARLRTHLAWVKSPEGELKRMQDELLDMQRQRSRSPESEVARIDKAMATLEEQIEEQRVQVENPKKAAKKTDKNVRLAINQAKLPDRKSKAGSHFINNAPTTVPGYFRGRILETKSISDFLQDDDYRIMHITGWSGMGKTVTALRVLKHLEAGKLPDDNGELAVDGIIYLSQVGERDLKIANLFPDLCLLLGDEDAESLDRLYREPMVSTSQKIKTLLRHFPPENKVVVLLDNFESVIDSENETISDSELDEALKALLDAPAHGVKVLITSQILARDLYMVDGPKRQRLIELKEGLESPFAEEILCHLDDGTLGLKELSDENLGEIADRIQRLPRALEAFVSWLEVDVNASLDDILTFAENELPENIVSALVGRAFNSLDTIAQQVIQALAIYDKPVPVGAIDFLLQHYTKGIQSELILKRLVNWRFIQQEIKTYSLHPLTASYALNLLERGNTRDSKVKNDPPLTQIAFYSLGADYFKKLCKKREQWKTLEDLDANLVEFDLRCRAEDWDTAARILQELGYSYLMLWGYYNLLIELGEKLHEQIINNNLLFDSNNLLGSAYFSIGKHNIAITYYEQALTQSKQMKYHKSQGGILGNLGNVYSSLGDTQLAIDYYQQALSISRVTKDKNKEAEDLNNIGRQMININDWGEAEQCFRDAVRLGDVFKDIVVQHYARWNLALLQLFQDQLVEAGLSIDEALSFSLPDNDFNAYIAKGIIILRQADTNSPSEAFEKAINEANDLMSKTPGLYSAIDGKSLAYCGLALLNKDASYVETAKKHFREARVNTMELKGHIRDIQRLFDALTAADADNLLEGVREAIAGE